MATTSQNLGLTIPAMGDAANMQPISDDLGIIDEFAGDVVKNSADAYDQGSTYVAGELCIQNNTVYKCKTDIDTPEAWDESHWEATSLGKEINSLNDQIAKLQTYYTIQLNTTDWNTNTTKCIKMGKLVLVKIYVQGTPENNKTIATGFPAPANANDPFVALGSSPSVITVNANGALYITSAGTGTYIGGMLMYLTA